MQMTMSWERTFKELRSEVDAEISIPACMACPFDFPGYLLGFQLLDSLKDTVLGTKSYDHLGNPKKKRLNPEFTQLSLKLDSVCIRVYLLTRLQLDPVNWFVRIIRSAVPDYMRIC
jgi:hypothetical protein